MTQPTDASSTSRSCTWCTRDTQVTCPECKGTGFKQEPIDANNEELCALLEEFVLYRDDTPHSNEPTELSVFLRQRGFPDAISRLADELQEFITSRDQQIALAARIDELEKLSWHKDHPPEFSGYEFSGSIPLSARIATLKAQEKS